MRIRSLFLSMSCALVAPFAAPANAAPACVVLNWQDGDWCTFEAPTRQFVFGGVATEILDGQRYPWVAVQVLFNGQVIASCYDQGTTTEPANCTGTAQAFAPTLTHVCQVYGSGGPKFHCADPPPLPVPLPVR